MAPGACIAVGKGHVRSVAILINPIVGDLDSSGINAGIKIIAVISAGAA
jgi:hypothetical protein